MKFFPNLHLKRSKGPSEASLTMIMPPPRNPLLLGSELSVILRLSADGSPSGIRTIRDMRHYRGRFGPGEWNHPRYGALTWMVRS